MIPLFNLHGYTAPDPLDNLTARSRHWLCSAVTFAICCAFLWVVFDVLKIAELHPGWLFWVECGGVALIYAPIAAYLRKCSSLVIAAMLAGLMIPIDVILEAHVRAKGLVAPWMYLSDGLLGGLDPLLRIVIVWTGDGLVMGPVALWLSRLLVSLFGKAPAPGAEPPTVEQRRAMFPDEWCAEKLTKPKRDFSFYVLRIVGIFYVAYCLLIVFGMLGVEALPPAVRPLLQMSYANPALTINTFIKISFVVNLAFMGAYNPALRFHVSLILFAAHLISTASLLLFYVLASSDAPYRQFLLLSVLADAAMAAFLLFTMIHYRKDSKRYRRAPEFPEFFSVPQRFTKRFWHIFAWTCAAIPIGVLAIRFLADPAHGWGAVYGYPDPLVSNTVTKYSTMSIIAFVIGNRDELRENMVVAIIDGFVISVVSSVIWLVFGDLVSKVGVHTRVGTIANVDWYFALNVGLDSTFAALILALRKMYYNVDQGIAALSVSSARNVMALHETLHPTSEDEGRVVRSIDRHVASIRGRKRGLLNVPFSLIENLLGLVYGLRPHFSTMSHDERSYWMRRYVLRPPDERRRSLVPPVAEIIYRLGSAAHAFVMLAHYSERAGRADIGYVPPGARKRLQGNYAASRPPSEIAPLATDEKDQANFAPPDPPGKPPLIAPRVVTPLSEPTLPDEVDYLIVGSGAGGAVVAYRLACESDPTRILVVERGPRFSPLTDFSDDEMDMVRKLYKEGGLQQTRRFGLTILQGECVGGSTVFNNGCCAAMPDDIRKIWQDRYGLDLSTLNAEYNKVADEIGINHIAPEAVNERVEKVFNESVAAYNDKNPNALKNVDIRSNHRNVLGTGLDNIGDRLLRKRSMLETYLPWAEGRGVTVAAETTAVRFVKEENNAKRAGEVILRTNMGVLKRVKVKKALIVSGGVIASSHFLMRSEVKGEVGNHVSCNFAFPSILEFESQLHAYDGLQITLGAIDPKSRAIFETYFNPPAAFSIAVPFYFQRHQSIMQRYKYLVNFGALVGSQPGGRVEREANVLDGRAISWSLAPADVANIKYAMQTLVDIARAGGAKRIVLRTEPGIDLNPTPENAKRFAESLASYPLSMSDLALVTAHPQGGNRMASPASPEGSTAVADAGFLLKGWENVYVADASVFPTGITVNPQWTIMALASMAASCILAPSKKMAVAQKVA